MALIAFEGFEQFHPNGFHTPPSASHAATYGRTITASGATPERAGLVAGRLNGQALHVKERSLVMGVPFSARTEIVTGIALKYTTASIGQPMLALKTGNTSAALLSVQYNKADGSISLFKDDTSSGVRTPFATGAAGRLQADQWFYIEVHVISNASLLYVDLRVNAQPYLEASTTPAFSGTFDQVQIGAFNAQFPANADDSVYFDDWYVLDTTGPDFNTFLGDCNVEQIVLANTAASNTFVGFNAGTVVEAVSDATIDFDTTYAYGDAAARALLLTPAPLDVSQERRVLAVEVNTVNRNSTADAVTSQPLITLGAAEVAATAASVGDAAYRAQRLISTTDPVSGLAWNAQTINDAAFGVRVASLTSPGTLRTTKAHLALLQKSTPQGARPTIHTTIIGDPA